MQTASHQWAHEIFSRCELGDRRRNRRLIEYAGRQAQHPQDSTHSVCEGSGALKEGTFRFLRNERVDPDSILEGGFKACIARLEKAKDVLVIEDTTTMKYWHQVAEELGELGGNKDRPSRGFLVHTALAVERETRDILGLLDQQWWIRETDRPGRNTRKKRPYAEKENFKWQRSSERIRERVSSTNSLIWVCDREADVYEYLEYKLRHEDRFVVRASYNRTVAGDAGHLWDQLRSEPVKYQRTVQIQQRGRHRGMRPKNARPARTAKTEVRACRITHTPQGKSPIKLHAVYVSEPKPPKDAEPLEWMLLTTEPIDDNSDIESIIKIYEQRWMIEEYHRVWKTGCRAEDRRFQASDNLRRILAILAFIAVRIMQLRTGLNAQSKASCEQVLSTPQWKCLYALVNPGKRLPRKAPNVKWAAQALAKLAGWIPTKRGMPPGYLTLWKGWSMLESRVEGWLLAMDQRCSMVAL